MSEMAALLRELTSPSALMRDAPVAALNRPRQYLIGTLAERMQVDERTAAQALAQEFNLAYWETASMAERKPLFERLPLAKAQQRGCVLFAAQGTDGDRGAAAVISDPYDRDLIQQLESLVDGPVALALATPADIHAYLAQREAVARAVDEVVAQDLSAAAFDAPGAEVLSLASLSDVTSQTVRLVNSTLYDALRSGASDVHFESTREGLCIKYRIDGVLDAVLQTQGNSLAEQTLSRLKVLAELDIAERRVPQDGSFRVSAQGRDIDLRVSIMPSVHGEDAVVRILDKQAIVAAHGGLTLDALGFDTASLRTLRALMRAPYGMLLVTGPTGSGKTTTLYGALAESHTGREKIITIEDPVEYQLPGILQIPVNEKKGLNFAKGLRSILRHDPDTIMIGEIRDRETAEIAVQSALTGHVVLTTVHANNVFDVFGRFTHMGLDPYALVSALNGIWAQRLIRLNCPHCSTAEPPGEEDLAWLQALQPSENGGAGDDLSSGASCSDASAPFKQGRGCGDCRGTGYKGRRAIAEILRLDDELRELIVQKAPVRQIKQLARSKGTRSLTEVALALARQGLTSLEEVRRVTVAA